MRMPSPRPLARGLAAPLIVLLGGLSALAVVKVPPAALAAQTGDRAPLEGRIEGRIEIRERPQRRIPNRYAGGGGAARPVQSLPTVIYLEGPIPGAASPRTATIAQRDSTFVPGVVVIPVGGSVVFPNEDPIFHNVFSYSTAQRFDLGRYPRGESKSVSFDRPGVVRIYCEVHESMRSAVIVTENPYHTVVADDGTFTLTGVPAGVHTLVAWHADLDEVRTEVRVTDGGTARVDLTLE
jgi:plastocyanin